LELIWLPVPAICENWESNLIFLNKANRDKRLQTEEKIAFHPIHIAIEFQNLLQKELVNNRSELAKRYGMSRARVTQLMNLLELAPEIQEHLLQLEGRKSIRKFSERRLRTLSQLQSKLTHRYQFQKLSNSQIQKKKISAEIASADCFATTIATLHRIHSIIGTQR